MKQAPILKFLFLSLNFILVNSQVKTCYNQYGVGVVGVNNSLMEENIVFNQQETILETAFIDKNQITYFTSSFPAKLVRLDNSSKGNNEILLENEGKVLFSTYDDPNLIAYVAVLIEGEKTTVFTIDLTTFSIKTSLTQTVSGILVNGGKSYNMYWGMIKNGTLIGFIEKPLHTFNVETGQSIEFFVTDPTKNRVLYGGVTNSSAPDDSFSLSILQLPEFKSKKVTFDGFVTPAFAHLSNSDVLYLWINTPLSQTATVWKLNVTDGAKVSRISVVAVPFPAETVVKSMEIAQDKLYINMETQNRSLGCPSSNFHCEPSLMESGECTASNANSQCRESAFAVLWASNLTLMKLFVAAKQASVITGLAFDNSTNLTSIYMHHQEGGNFSNIRASTKLEWEQSPVICQQQGKITITPHFASPSDKSNLDMVAKAVVLSAVSLITLLGCTLAAIILRKKKQADKYRKLEELNQGVNLSDESLDGSDSSV